MTTRKARPPRSTNYLTFEERTTATLESQNQVLETQNQVLDKQNTVLDKLEKKLESPILNGGFDELVKRVEKIDTVTEKLRECQTGTSEKVDDSNKKIAELHTVILDPETGLYHKVKTNTKWIDTASKGLKWFAGLAIAGILTGIGKILYDVFSGHIHYTP